MEFKFKKTLIESMAYKLPDRVITSQEIEQRLSPLYNRLKLPFGRLELMTGITERRVSERGEAPSKLAIQVGLEALERSSLSPKDIDLLILASVCRDYLEPATSSKIHSRLNLRDDCQFYDLSNACLGVLSAWVHAACLIESNTIRSALIVTSENSTDLLESTIQHLLSNQNIVRKDIKKYIASLTIGSGAHASILVSSDFQKNGHPLLGGSFLTDTSSHGLCHGGEIGPATLMETDSENLMKAGINLAQRNFKKFQEVLAWDQETPNHIITHQVGEIHQRMLYQKLGLSPHKDFKTYPFLGNTGSAALPITLSMGDEKSIFKKEDQLLLLGIGSGLSSIILGALW